MPPSPHHQPPRPPRSPRLLSTLAALSLLPALACDPSSRPPTCPSQGGRHWTELTTKHFTLLTDVDPDAGRAAAADFETAFAELNAAAFPRPDQGPRFTIVLFDDDHARLAFRPPTTGAEYDDKLRLDLERSPTIILTAARYTLQKSQERQVFLHELTHSFIAHTYGGVPVWLNEGLAQYLSTMRVEDGKAVLGEIPFGYRLTRGFIVSVGELLAVDRWTFYGEQKQTFAGQDARYRYYTGSWAFVHFLQDGPYRAQFQAFIQKLDAGAVLRKAWGETLGRVPKADMEQSFLTYTTGDSWVSVERPIHPAVQAAIERARPLGDDEVHLLWARLADPTLPPADPRSAEAQIAEAGRASPDSPEVSYRRGCLALVKGRTDEAEAQFEAALAIAPNEPRYLFAALEALGTEASRQKRLAQTRFPSWLDGLTKSARSADELSMLARIEADQEKDADALHHADAALAADPGYYGPLASRAFVHFRAGRYAEAVANQERAVALAPERVDTEALSRTLRAYREALVGADGVR